jgi:hypothetical protein
MAKKETSLDYTNAITSSHVEDANAFNVINVNTLIPPNHGKIELEYVAAGINGQGNIGKVDYYSKGDYQITQVVTRGDALGTAHKVTLNFSNRTPESLSGKSFVIYDNTGAVNVWFNVDFLNSEPVNPSTYRSIEVSLLSSHSSQVIAQKVALAMSMDSQFIGVYTLNYVIISSSTSGVKPDAYDVSTGVYIKNTAGTEPLPLNNKYFLINSANNSTEYYVWYNVGGLGTNPSIAGKTGIMVPISTGSTAATVAQKTKEMLDLNPNFITNIDNETLLITNKEVGISDNSEEGNSGFLIFTSKSGENRVIIATIVLGYDSANNLISVERL